MKTQGKPKTRSSPRKSMPAGKGKVDALKKARSLLKKGERANTPVSIKKKMKNIKEK